jgi:hypothetical protein
MANRATWTPTARAGFTRPGRDARAAGALAELPVYLSSLALDNVWNGDLTGATYRKVTRGSATRASFQRRSAQLLSTEEGSRDVRAIAATIEQATARDKAGGEGGAVGAMSFTRHRPL